MTLPDAYHRTHRRRAAWRYVPLSPKAEADQGIRYAIAALAVICTLLIFVGTARAEVPTKPAVAADLPVKAIPGRPRWAFCKFWPTARPCPVIHPTPKERPHRRRWQRDLR